MSQFKNIKEYCEKSHITVEELKDMILETSINLGCEVVNNFGENPHQTQQAFTTLYFFDDILSEVE